MDLTMKNFKEYLAESKKTYAFKIKIAGDLEEGFVGELKSAMEKFAVASMSGGKRTPIQETPLDFPDSKYTHVHVFDLEVNYPTTSQVLENYISQMCGVVLSNIRVRAANEPTEQYQTAMMAKETDQKALLNQCDYPAEDNQGLVGEKAKMSLLKELEKIKHGGEQYKGVNDEILAKSVPTGASAEQPATESTESVLKGQKGNPDPRKGN